MAYINAVIALIPIFSKLLDVFIKTPEEQKEELRQQYEKFMAELPARLKEIKSDNDKASETKDPSIINRGLNDR